MTLVEIRNQIFTHFLGNDTFNLQKDHKKIKLDLGQNSSKLEIIKSVLDDMAEDGFCNAINTESGYIYVMCVPLGTEGQQVAITNVTAELLAEIVNQFREATDQKDGLVNKMKISEYDIQNICLICAQLMESLDPESGSAEDENPPGDSNG